MLISSSVSEEDARSDKVLTMSGLIVGGVLKAAMVPGIESTISGME